MDLYDLYNGMIQISLERAVSQSLLLYHRVGLQLQSSLEEPFSGMLLL